MRLQIDKEFESLCPPLKPDERSSLEASLLKHGCRDALVIWKGKDILIDGHNRFRLCQKHALPYDTVQEDLADREAARNWIIKNQLSRRNITSETASYLRGSRYNNQKQTRRGTRGNGKAIGHDVTLLDNAERIAGEFGLSSRTIKRDGKFAAAVDAIVVRCKQVDVKPLMHSMQLARMSRSDLVKHINYLRNTGKLPRIRKRQEHVELPPRALAGVLMSRLGLRKAKTLYRELGRLLTNHGEVGNEEVTRLLKQMEKNNGNKAD